MKVRIGGGLLAALALAACQDQKTPEQERAEGDILPASVSDSMLPLDTVRSQPPLAPQTQAGRPGGKAKDSDAAKTPEDSSSEAPAPAASSPSPGPTASAAAQ